MASFVNRKARVFRDAGDAAREIIPKRSEARMKTYHSATDARAWCGEFEPRRQHILELLKQDTKGLSIGKYVPIEVLIDTLLANKNADLERLKNQLEELQKLLDMYESILTPEQRRQLDHMMGGLESLSGSKLEGTFISDTEVEGVEEVEGVAEIEEVEEHEDTTTTLSEKGIEGDLDSSEEYECAALRRQARERKEREARAQAEQTGDETETETTELKEAQEQTYTAEVAAAEQQVEGPRLSDAEQQKDSEGADVDGDLKAIIIEKDAEIISLQNALAAAEAERDEQNRIAVAAIEQLENLKGIVEERDSLRRSIANLQTIGRVPSTDMGTSTDTKDPCGLQEIAALEAEIQQMRAQGTLTPEQEAEVIRKEVEVLKKYCMKLAAIQEENTTLKVSLKNCEEERQRLQARVDQLEKGYPGELPAEMEALRKKSVMIDDIIIERDNLAARLIEMQDLEREVETLKKKADRADALEKELKALRGENEELDRSRRASEVEYRNLSSQQAGVNKELESLRTESAMLRKRLADTATAEEEVERLRYRAKESEVLRIERDRLKVRLDELAAIEVEFMELLEKTRCLETIKAEREMYKSKYEELLGLECECDMLRAQVERSKQAILERDALQRQVRDCECCIADQEDEIKRLITHVDRLSQGRDEQQGRMKEALGNMRAELEEKTCLIAASEEQLAGVQDQLKSTIAGVSCETTCLRARIEELEAELCGTKAKLREKEKEIEFLQEHIEEKDELISNLNSERTASMELAQAAQGKDEVISQLKKELDSCKSESEKLQSLIGSGGGGQSLSGDEHLESMLKRSKCAVRRVAEELSKHYQNWDCMQGRFPEEDDIDELRSRLRESEDIIQTLREKADTNDQILAENSALRRHSAEVQEVAKDQIQELVDHLQKCKEQVAQLQAENEQLRQNVMGIGTAVAAAAGAEPAVAAAAGTEPAVVTAAATDPTAVTAAGTEPAPVADMAPAGVTAEPIVATAGVTADPTVTAAGVVADPGMAAAGVAAAPTTVGASASCEELRKELEEVQREKEQLQATIKSIQESVPEGSIEAQYMQLKIDYDNLELQLQKEIELRKAAEARGGGEGGGGGGFSDEERDSLLRQIEDQKQEIENLIAQLSSTDAGAQLAKEIQEKRALKDIINDLEAQMRALSGSQPLPISTAGGGGADVEALQARIRELEAARESGDQVTIGKQEYEDLKKKIKCLEEELARLKEANENAISAAAALSGLNLSAEDQAKVDAMRRAYELQIAELKNELEKLKGECGESIASLKAQYDRDIKNVHNKHTEGISKLMSSHEEVIKDLGSQHEKEVTSLRDELRKSKEFIDTIGSRTSRSEGSQAGTSRLSGRTMATVDIKPKETADVCICGGIADTKLKEILEKSLKDGLESLEYEELQFLHTKVCEATDKLQKLEKMTARRERRSSVVSPPRHSITSQTRPSEEVERMPPVRDMDKMSLMQRVETLECELLRKQKQAQQKVAALQIAVKLERQRLEELKRTLDVERQRNTGSYGEDKSPQFVVTVEQDSKRDRSSSGRHGPCPPCQDSDTADAMRIRLEKPLNSEMMLRMQLEQKSRGGPPPCPPPPCVCTKPLPPCQRPPPCPPCTCQSPPKTQVTTFYTELTVKDVKKKQNFVHHCCLRDKKGPSSDSRKSSAPSSPTSD